MKPIEKIVVDTKTDAQTIEAVKLFMSLGYTFGDESNFEDIDFKEEPPENGVAIFKYRGEANEYICWGYTCDTREFISLKEFKKRFFKKSIITKIKTFLIG